MSPGFVVFGALFFIGFATIFVLIGRQGALAKSKQLSALGALSRGAAGRGAQLAFFIALGGVFFGACGLFGTVAAGDAQRRKACEETCASRGYAKGAIGPSKEKDPKNKNRPMFVACHCTGHATEPPLELQADVLQRVTK